MGWNVVTDLDPRTRQPVKHPMIGWRYCDMEDGTGYLAVKYPTTRYIYEGVPPNKVKALSRTMCASSYLRQHIRSQYPCVETKIDTEGLPEAYRASTPQTKHIRTTEVPEGIAPPQMGLFPLLDVKRKKRSRSISTGSTEGTNE